MNLKLVTIAHDVYLPLLIPSHPEKGISKEPLKTLSTFRRSGNEVNFGIYLIPKKMGIIRLNDEIIPG